MLLPGAAFAAPGDASARGVIFDLDAAVGGVAVVTANQTFGVADAPPGGGTDQDTDIPVALAPGAVGVSSTGTVNEVRATRGPAESSAFVRVTGAGATILGVPGFSTGEASATAVCPAVGAITATTTLTGFTLLGTPTTLAPNTPPVSRSVGVVLPGVTGAQLTATARRVETVTATDAFALAAEVTFAITGTTVTGAPVTIPLGTVTIARATCTRPTAVPAAPTAAGIAPGSGPTSGGQTVTITGTGFVPGATTVTFDGVPATAVTVSPDGTSLTAVTPAGAAGPADVVVSTAAGAAAPLDYTYVAPAAPPTATGIAPDSGPTVGGQTVTITGTGFVPGATTVTFDGVPATAVTVSPDGTSLTAVTPAGAAGPADVVVSTADGDAAPLDYTYVAPGGGGGGPGPAPGPGPGPGPAPGPGPGPAPAPGPAPGPGPGGDGGGSDDQEGPSVDGLDPDSGPTAGGTEVTVRGRNFVPGRTSVIICGRTLPPSEVQVGTGGGSLSFTTPACGAGLADVVVATPNGAAGSLPFTYVDGTGSNGSLPNTGADVTAVTLLGISLLVVGGVLARRARRRPVIAA